jgi:hypothetical protein
MSPNVRTVVTIAPPVARDPRHAAQAVAPLSAVAALDRAAVAALAGVAVLVLAAVCWVLDDEGRTDRANRVILGIRGDAVPLPT